MSFLPLLMTGIQVDDTGTHRLNSLRKRSERSVPPTGRLSSPSQDGIALLLRRGSEDGGSSDGENTDERGEMHG